MKNKKIPVNLILMMSLLIPFLYLVALKFLEKTNPNLACKIIDKEMGCLHHEWILFGFYAVAITSVVFVLYVVIFKFRDIKVRGFIILTIWLMLFSLLVWAKLNIGYTC